MTEELSIKLEELQGALRKGQFSQLPIIADGLSTLADALENEEADITSLFSLRTQAEKTLQLLDSSKKGVEVAMHRVREISDVRQGLSTYHSDGKRRVAAVEETYSKRL